MITTCTVCQARYQLEDEKIPRRVIRVRCPACKGVFTLDGTAAPSPQEAPAAALDTSYVAPPAPAPVPETAVPAFTAPVPEPTPAPVPAPTPAPVATAAPTATAVADEPAAAAPRRRRSKEEMLARALVSDILVYNREQRDRALADGNLLEAMGPEIKKSWELYKEKVTAEVANSTNHFRDALNEILAEGDKIF